MNLALELFRGESRTITLTVIDRATGLPANLTSGQWQVATAAWQMNPVPATDTPTLEKSLGDGIELRTQSGADLGKLDLSIEPTEITAVEPGNYTHDLVVTFTGGQRIYLIRPSGVVVRDVASLHTTIPDPGTPADPEADWFRARAALLDPRCWHLVSGSGLDVTVPEGHTWYTSNAFAVTYGDPLILAQDAFPNNRRSGFIRPLDARQAMALPAGTRIKANEDGSTDSYLWYADPADVVDIDPRYLDPRGLYYERLMRLEALTEKEVIIEATGGGGIDDDLHLTVPGTGAIMITQASVFDASWATIGFADDTAHPLNLWNEINNSHSLRTGASLLQPMPRGAGLLFALRKGSTSDLPGSTDPQIAYPIKGSGSMCYVDLPSDW